MSLQHLRDCRTERATPPKPTPKATLLKRETTGRLADYFATFCNTNTNTNNNNTNNTNTHSNTHSNTTRNTN